MKYVFWILLPLAAAAAVWFWLNRRGIGRVTRPYGAFFASKNAGDGDAPDYVPLAVCDCLFCVTAGGREEMPTVLFDKPFSADEHESCYTLGSSEACDYHFDDPYMDPVHARITVTDENGRRKVTLDASGTTNGIRQAVEGKKSAEKADALELEGGERFFLGNTQFLFETDFDRTLLDERRRAERCRPTYTTLDMFE